MDEKQPKTSVQPMSLSVDKDLFPRKPVSSGIADILSAIVNISETGVYHEPTCIVCSSPHRQDSEKVWNGCEAGIKDREVRVSQYFVSVGEVVSEDAIKNHMNNHLGRGDAELRKVEYIARLSNLSSFGMTTMDQVKIGMAAVMECLTGAGAIVPTKIMSYAKAQEVKAKVVTQLVKTWTDLLALQAKILGEMDDKGELVKLPKDAFMKVFDDALTNAKTQGDRDLISSIMKGLETITEQQQ